VASSGPKASFVNGRSMPRYREVKSKDTSAFIPGPPCKDGSHPTGGVVSQSPATPSARVLNIFQFTPVGEGEECPDYRPTSPWTACLRRN
jgi:hypothetical protein